MTQSEIQQKGICAIQEGHIQDRPGICSLAPSPSASRHSAFAFAFGGDDDDAGGDDGDDDDDDDDDGGDDDHDDDDGGGGGDDDE